jgi:uncharacterized protein YlxP (DUF503 family)
MYVGVLCLNFVVPGARSRKDRRRVLRSFRDRVRHRFSVSVHEIDDLDLPTQQCILVTTGGNDRGKIMHILDKVANLARSGAEAWPSSVDLEVFRWHSKMPTLSTFPNDNQDLDDE